MSISDNYSSRESGDISRSDSGVDFPIAVVGPHPPLRGGIAHFTERVSSALAETGRHVVRVSFSRLYPKRLFPGKSQYEPGAAVESSSTPASSILDSLNPASWKKAANLVIKSGASTAVFMYWMPFFAPAYGGMIKRLKKHDIKIVGVVHNALPHENHVGAAFLSARFIRSCDSIITLSDSVRGDVLNLDSEAAISVHAHPTYDQFGNSITQEAARAHLDIVADGNILLFFGLVRKYKGLMDLLDAMPSIIASNPNTLLIVAGEFYDDISPFQKKIDELKIDSNVRLVNEYIPSNEVRNYFCAADLVVQPYTEATQSGVIPIARHFGVPCVATDIGGLPEAVNSNGVIVPPGNPDALSHAINDWLSDPVPHSTRIDTDPTNELTWDAFVFALLEEEYRLLTN